MLKKIEKINCVLADYFSKHKGEKVRAKDMMERFIEAGIFQSDIREGLPIRKLLRELDEKNMLHLIPYLYADRKAKNTNWYFSDNISQ